MIITTITELLSTGSSLSLGVPVGVSVAASSIVMFSLGALTASLVCLLCNLRDQGKLTSPLPALLIQLLEPTLLIQCMRHLMMWWTRSKWKENAIYTNMGQRCGFN